jgi:hypothetical protein
MVLLSIIGVALGSGEKVGVKVSVGNGVYVGLGVIVFVGERVFEGADVGVAVRSPPFCKLLSVPNNEQAEIKMNMSKKMLRR